jgi:hypothetical protein
VHKCTHLSPLSSKQLTIDTSYDIESGRKVHTFIDDCVKDGDLYIRSVCFSPDGQHLATGTPHVNVSQWW